MVMYDTHSGKAKATSRTARCLGLSHYKGVITMTMAHRPTGQHYGPTIRSKKYTVGP